MVETEIRAYFERAALAELPPSTVDVALARKAGRRRLTIRRAGLPAMVLGVIAATGALFATGLLPTGATAHRATTRTHHRGALAAPASFDPLAVWATFGWLPPGFKLVAPPPGEMTTVSEMDANGPNGQSISLQVFAARRCELTGPFWWPPDATPQTPSTSPGATAQTPSTSPGATPQTPSTSQGGARQRGSVSGTRYPAGLRCKWGPRPYLPRPVIPSGHLPGGDSVYTMLGFDGRPTALAWHYARGGWAIATWSGRRPAQVVRVVEHIRYRSHLRRRFPFMLVGIPASWKLTDAGYQPELGKLMGYALYMGPSQDPGGMRVTVQPAFQPSCVFTGGRQQQVSFDGARGVLVSTPSESQQDVCFPSLHGMFVWVSIDDQLGRAMSVLRHVRVLGPDPANWTTHPLG